MSFIASAIGSQLAKKALGAVVKDRNILIPLDDPKETQLLTDKQLKSKFCPIKAISTKTSPRRKVKKKAKRKTRLDTVLERLSLK